MDRWRELPLQIWGMACIFGGMVSGLVLKSVHPPRNRPELLGQGLAQLFFLILGVVLVGMGLVRKRRG